MHRWELVYDVRDVDASVFPKFAQANEHAIYVEQQAGETIFVPSGWYHQVINVTDCISVRSPALSLPLFHLTVGLTIDTFRIKFSHETMYYRIISQVLHS